jgi:hypothetical protein
LIKIAVFIDYSDPEHSSSRAVLFRRQTRRNRSGGPQYSLRHLAASRERSNRETKIAQQLLAELETEAQVQRP